MSWIIASFGPPAAGADGGVAAMPLSKPGGRKPGTPAAAENSDASRAGPMLSISAWRMTASAEDESIISLDSTTMVAIL